jgi:DNA-binding protein YbaB
VDESLLSPSEKTMLEDLVAAAINDARAKADSAAAAEMQNMQSTLSLPPGFELPF